MDSVELPCHVRWAYFSLERACVQCKNKHVMIKGSDSEVWAPGHLQIHGAKASVPAITPNGASVLAVPLQTGGAVSSAACRVTSSGSMKPWGYNAAWQARVSRYVCCFESFLGFSI